MPVGREQQTRGSLGSACVECVYHRYPVANHVLPSMTLASELELRLVEWSTSATLLEVAAGASIMGSCFSLLLPALSGLLKHFERGGVDR